MKSMLKILVIILQFVVFSSTYGQSFPSKNMTYGVWANRFLPDSTLYLPTGCGFPSDSTFLHDKSAQRFHAAKYYDSCGHQEYTWDPSYKFWKVAIPDSVNGFITHTALVDSLLPIKSTLNTHTTEIYSNTVAISALNADSLFQAAQIAALQSGKVSIGGDSHGSSFAIGTNDFFSLGIKTNGHWTYSFGTDGSFGSYNNPFNNDASGNLTAQTLSGLNLTSGMVKAFGNELINAITWTDFVPAIRNGLIRYEKHTEPYGYGFGGQYYDSVRQQGFFAGMNEFKGPYSMHFLINWDSSYNHPKINAMDLDSAGNVVFAGKIIGDTLNSQALSGWNSMVKVDSATGNLIPATIHVDYLTPSDTTSFLSPYLRSLNAAATYLPLADTTYTGFGQVLTQSKANSLYVPSSSGITGSLSTGQIAFGSGTNTITGNSNLFWDNSNYILKTNGSSWWNGISAITPINSSNLTSTTNSNAGVFIQNTNYTPYSGSTTTYNAGLFVSNLTQSTSSGAAYNQAIYAFSLPNSTSSAGAIGYGVNSNVKATQTGSGGILINAFNGTTTVENSQTTTTIQQYGGILNVQRNVVNDLSGVSGNSMWGLQLNLGHTGTVSTILTSNITGVSSLLNITTGTIGIYYGFFSKAYLSTTATPGVIGSYYGVFLASPSTGATNSTITNNYGVYQQDATALNYYYGKTYQQNSLFFSNSFSAPYWGGTTNNGVLLNVSNGYTITDATSSGTVSNGIAMNYIGASVLAASNTTTYSQVATLQIAGAPTAGSNVTITTPIALLVNSGNTQLKGNLYLYNSVSPNFNSRLYIGGNYTSPVALSSSAGAIIQSPSITLTDNASAVNATVSTGAGITFSGSTIAATNTGVTYTNFATLYLTAPTQGTNVTITNPFALMVGGTSNAYIGGSLLIGSITNNGVDKLQLTGSVISTQYKLSALNTAPSSSTATGTLGEIRVTSSYIYICTATNTWVRAALSSF